MLIAVLVLYLLGLGPLVLFGLWRIEQQGCRAAVERRLNARRLSRVIRLVSTSVRRIRTLRADLGGSGATVQKPIGEGR